MKLEEGVRGKSSGEKGESSWARILRNCPSPLPNSEVVSKYRTSENGKGNE